MVLKKSKVLVLKNLLRLGLVGDSLNYIIASREKNVSLSVHAEVAMYFVETIKTCPSLPPAVDVPAILLDRTTRLKHFFTCRETK